MRTRVSLQTLLAVAMALGGAGATAATIEYQTRPMTSFNIPSVGDYRGWWNAQPGAASPLASLANFNGTTAPAGYATSYSMTTDDVFSHLRVSFVIPAGQTWKFQLAPDAGYGGALYFNDSASSQDVDASDLWWGGSWNSVAEILEGSAIGAGFFDAYWAEDCCNGGQGARFSTDNGVTWRDLTVANLDAAAVPVPAAIWLFGSAMAGLLGLSRRRRV